MHVERTATFHLPIPPERALPLFTPEGERDWVDGWDPIPLHAPGGSMSRAGAVFRTAAGGEETLWLVLGVDAAAGASDYVRVTPGNRMGSVHVRCRAAAGGGTEVEVTYRLTALGPEGETVLAGLGEVEYASMIDGWRQEIERHLERAG